MKVTIKKLTNDCEEISNVQKFLFSMIKQEFGYDYVPEWHQDIVKMDEYYISPKRNNFFVAYTETGEIIATIGIRAYDKDFPELFSIAENFANEMKYDDIYLHTHKTLPGALEFWTKMGFVVALDSNDELETVHMDKKIVGLDINPSANDFYYAVKL